MPSYALDPLGMFFPWLLSNDNNDLKRMPS